MLENINWRPWYNSLNKPEWTPNGEIIAIVWWILYPIIIITYSYVFYRAFFAQRRISKIVTIPFFINLVANFTFVFLFFVANNILYSTVDILIVLVTIIWGIVAIWPYKKIVALFLLPYLMWVFLVSILQVSLAFLNP